MRQGRGNAGFSLIEMPTCITILAVLSSVIAVAYDAMLDQVRAANKQVQLLVDVQRAQRLIANDVRRATVVPDAYGTYDADASTLICIVPAADTSDEVAPDSSVIVYTLAGREARGLVRRVFADAGDSASYTETTILGNIESVVFDRSLDAGGQCVRFTITAPNDLMHKDAPTVYSFVVGRQHE